MAAETFYLQGEPAALGLVRRAKFHLCSGDLAGGQRRQLLLQRGKSYWLHVTARGESGGGAGVGGRERVFFWRGGPQHCTAPHHRGLDHTARARECTPAPARGESLSLCGLSTEWVVQVKEEVVEDFVRNFLVSVGLEKTADIFQAEW